MASFTYVGDYNNEPLDLFVLNNIVSSSSSSSLSSSPSSSSSSYCSLQEEENRASLRCQQAAGYGDLFSPCPSPYSPLSVLDPEFHGSLASLIFEDPFLQADQAMATSCMVVDPFDPFDCLLPTSSVEVEQSNGTGACVGSRVDVQNKDTHAEYCPVQNNGFAEEMPLMLTSNVPFTTSTVALALPSDCSKDSNRQSGDVTYANCTAMSGFGSSPQSPTTAVGDVSGCDSSHQKRDRAETSDGDNVGNGLHQHQNVTAAATACLTPKLTKKAKLSTSGHCNGDIQHQMVDKKQVLHDDLNAYAASCSLNMMKEVVYAQAALQPVDWDSVLAATACTRPKRRNVRISKDPQSISARRRRERISDRIRVLQQLVPNGTKMDTASMLDEAIHYLKFLKSQVQAFEWLEKSSPSPAPTSSSGSGSSSISLSMPLASSLSSSSSSSTLPYYCPATLVCPSFNSQMWMNNSLPTL